MADTKPEEDKKQESLNELIVGQNVASLSIPTIIFALHEKALEQANKILGNGAKGKLVNSTVDKDGKLKSAGEHIISIIPNEKKEPVQKTIAIQALKTYVQWFSGPDLANKVDDKTVKPLTESPMQESNHFMSFKSFLMEADEESNDEKDNEEDSNNKSNDDEKNSKNDENIQSNSGYYITYKLEVEGIKQTALKDAMKKFASTFFDDLTITGSGLFGGGGNSFSIKDIKQKFRDVFGPIDPNDLVQNIEKELKTKYPKTDPVQVEVQDKDTLISDIGNQADAAQKKLINKSKYSLFIKVTEHDPKKNILNQALIADIVTSSIKGLFKKFKNAITKNDVVYIADYRDEHADTVALKKLYTIVPTPEQVKKEIEKNGSLDKAFGNLEKMFDVIKKDKQFDNCNRAKKCHEVFNKFYKDPDVQKQKESIKNSTNLDTKLAFFKNMLDNYEKVFKATNDPQLNESSNVNFNLDMMSIKKMLIESLFKYVMPLHEEENQSGNEDGLQITIDQLQKDLTTILQKKLNSSIHNVFVAKPDAIKEKFRLFDLSKFDAQFGDNTYGAAIDVSDTLNDLKESIKSSILNILMHEAEKQSKEDKKEKTQIDLGNVTAAFTNAFEQIFKGDKNLKSGDVFGLKFGATKKDKVAEYIESKKLSQDDALKPESIDDIKNELKIDNEESIKKKIKKYFKDLNAPVDLDEKFDAYVKPFSYDLKVDPAKSEEVDVDNNDAKGKEDLYIVPIPDMNYKDKEYDTYA